MESLIQEGHNHNENCIPDKVSRRTLKVEIYLANEQSDLAFFDMDFLLIFRGNVGNAFGAMLDEKDLINQNLLPILSAYSRL